MIDQKYKGTGVESLNTYAKRRIKNTLILNLNLGTPLTTTPESNVKTADLFCRFSLNPN